MAIAERRGELIEKSFVSRHSRNTVHSLPIYPLHDLERRRGPIVLLLIALW